MNKKLAIIIGAVGLVLLLGFGLKLYGQARYDEGYNKSQAEHAAAAAKAADEAARNLGKVENETANMSDDAIDDSLRALGIMRQPSDR
ncbi:MAG: hypothetical protein RBT70_08725 [Alphaproteobacteria bacterium]|jgi:hypothetical protein|nr:hypothetical protein [Alphaproteobacteria bacterium]